MCANRRSVTCAHAGSPDVCSWTISEDDVVDQFGFADPNGADGSITMTHIVDALKRVGVHDREITRRKSDDSLEHPPASSLQRAGPSLSACTRVPHREERLGENQTELAVPRREVSVSAGHRQSIVVPHDRRNQDPNREIEIAHHSLHRGHLLKILLAKDRDVRHHDMKELCNYS